MSAEVAEVGTYVSSPVDGAGMGCSGVVSNMSVTGEEEVPDGAYRPLQDLFWCRSGFVFL